MELSRREERAIMLETHTPAFARSIEDRRALDDLYRDAKKLTAITGMRHAVQPLVPLEHDLVSGLNCTPNYEITVAAGPKTKNKFWRTMSDHTMRRKSAVQALEARNG